jgi:hypothetical protein
MASHPEKGKIRKQVMYFLAEAQYEPLTLLNLLVVLMMQNGFL